MDWTLYIENKDGVVAFEADVLVYCTVEYNGSEYDVEVTGFRINQNRFNPDTGEMEEGKASILFDANSDTLWGKHLFLHIKEILEDDYDFLAAAIDDWESDERNSWATIPPEPPHHT